MLTTEEFKKHMLGYNIVDCVVRKKDFYYFLAREDYTQDASWNDAKEPPDETVLKKRVIPFQPYKSAGQHWSNAQIGGFEITSGGVAYEPSEQFVAMSLTGQIYAVGSGAAGLESRIPYSVSGRRSVIVKLITIGQKLYAVGLDRTIGIRQGKDDWAWQSDKIPFDEKTEEGKCGFYDLHGLDESHMYAVGKKGEVWISDAAKWGRCAFPSNITLETVCCIPGGNVYVSGYEGETYRGAGDVWKQIAKPELSIPFKDMVWYEDRVWCTNDYGLWWINGDKLEMADVPSEIKVCSGNLSTRDGVLLLAGYYGAAVRENGEWKVIFNYNEMAEKSGR
jgi:hypothetical protein